MEFELAFNQVKNVGCLMRRTSWNKNNFVKLVRKKDEKGRIFDSYNINLSYAGINFETIEPQFTPIRILPYFVLRIDDNREEYGWNPSVDDLLATDWETM